MKLAIQMCFWVVISVGGFIPVSQAESPSRPLSSFTSAKDVARNTIYKDHREDFYCGCPFKPSASKSGGVIQPSACGYKPRSDPDRGKRLEWEHVMPAYFFGHTRTCWKTGHKTCVTKENKKYKGRACCAKVDKAFQQMEADLHNLVPAVGELNGNRSNTPFGMVAGEPRAYGRCDFEIGGKPRVTEPRPSVRGDAARVWLYMSETYGIRLTEEKRSMFQDWSRVDPPDQWERLRDRRIAAAQGNRNPFVSQAGR